MKTLRNYEVAGALLLAGTGVPAAVGDQVTLYLDTDANGDFPESIIGIIQHPITRVNCDAYTSYDIEYDEADLAGAAALLHTQDVIDAVLIVQADIIAANLTALTAVVALKAPIASPTFTGTVTLPSTTSIGSVSDTELAFVNGVTSAIQTQIDLKSPLASPTFTGVPAAPTAAPLTSTTQLATTNFVTLAAGVVTAAFVAADLLKAPLASPSFTGIVTLGDAVDVVLNATVGTKIGTATTEKLAFHNSTPVIQRAGAAQALVTGTVGAAVVTTASALTSYGFTQAQADSIPVRINSLIVDNAAQTVLLNEIRAALVEKGIIKGAA